MTETAGFAAFKTPEINMEIITRHEDGNALPSVGRSLDSTAVDCMASCDGRITEHPRNARNMWPKTVSKMRGDVMEELHRSLTLQCQRLYTVHSWMYWRRYNKFKPPRS